MNCGPTERIGFFGAFVSFDVDASGAGAVAACGVAAGSPGLAAAGRIGRPWASRGSDNALARSSVTRMSPCSSVARLSTFFIASAQLSPGRRQLHALSTDVRYLNAFGSSL